MIPAILLAAGLSSRFPGQNKLLLSIGAESLIRQVVRNFLVCDFSEILVVVGNEWKSIVQELRDFKVTFIYNPDYKLGMMSSIQQGLRHLTPDGGFMIATGDTPGITSRHLQNLISAYHQTTSSMAIIRSHSEEGFTHPTIFADDYRDILLQVKETTGAKHIIDRYQDHLFPVESTPQILQDIDTMRDYAVWKAKNEN